MTFNNRRSSESRLDEAWRAFVEEDAEVHAPPGLEGRVLRTVHGPTPPVRPHRLRYFAFAASVAAAVLLVLAFTLRHRVDPQQSPASIPVARQAPDADSNAVNVPAAPVAEASATLKPRRAALGRRQPRETLPPILMSLGASPVRDTEVLQLVRLRLPREALQTLGVVLLEPDAGGVVDVDVLIGEDGVARDIRQVRAGQEQETPPW